LPLGGPEKVGRGEQHGSGAIQGRGVLEQAGDQRALRVAVVRRRADSAALLPLGWPVLRRPLRDEPELRRRSRPGDGPFRREAKALVVRVARTELAVRSGASLAL